MKDDIRAGVYILAQNRLVREALSRILANKSDIVVVGSSSPSEASVQEIVATTPDVLVIDFGGEIIFVSVQRYSGGNLLAGPWGRAAGWRLNSFVNSGVSGVVGDTVSATPLPN